MTTSSQALHHLSIHQAAELIRSRQLSPVELTQAFLDRIEAIDDRLKSYITLLPEAAMEAARAAEAEIFEGQLSWPAARHPHRLEGPVRHCRRAYHGPVQGTGAPCAR